MLRILQLESIERLLMEASDLLQMYNAGGMEFLEQVDLWAHRVETELQRNRLAISSSVAALRAGLQSAREGVVPSQPQATERVKRRKQQRAFAAEVLRGVVELVQSHIKPDRDRFDEAERISTQLIAIIRAHGLISDNHTGEVGQLLKSLKESDATVQGVVHLEGLTGPTDAIIVFDRMLAYTSTRPTSRRAS